jgi:branched-chain amino acid aminotransferase
MGIESKYIWMDGKLVEYDKALVHFNTAALHYGPSVFEGIRCYETDKGPAVFRLKDHIKRLVESAAIIGMRNLPYTAEQIVEAVKETVRANGFQECYIRPLIYAGGNSLGLNMDAYQIFVGISMWEWKTYLGLEALENGISANVSSYTRNHPNAVMTKAKAGGYYVNSIMAKTESLRLGFEEAIMLDPQGYVGECTGENLFIVKRGKIYTTPMAAILEGITRDSVLMLANDQGYEVFEKPIGRDQLYTADELFVCGTAAEVVPIREVDGRMVGSGKRGPIARALQESYTEAIHGRHKFSPQWLDYVNE